MTAPAIRTSALTRTFGSHRGIRDVELEVAPGEVFGFLGPNGAGKSTTIRILMGLIRPTSGTAQVLGGHPQRDGVAVRSRVGYLPGDLALHPRTTGRELLERFGHVRGLRDTRYRDELVERFGADLDRNTQSLSKGNRQKLGIVLAFMHQPELLVLDEPTSGLDPLLQNEFARLLEETAQDGRTVFLSSHDLDEVQRVAHRVAIIREGRVVVTDTVDGLRSHAPRTIELQLEGGVEDAVRSLSEVDGVETETVGPHRLRLTVNGPVAPVLRAVAPLDPVDLTARPADLDELFLGYYRNESGQQEKETSHAR
ncbi:MAG TPA: ABC transporter ATP-binding protein [Angustibacter sp.]|nr:ABC transporter ATP-binding protein [Angustibacter sp.]